MANYPTPHIAATPADFGKTVLMPGDPLRAKFIAENYLENAKLVNNVRGIQGYTGYYKNMKISVMASGMGMPSIGIYSYELFNFFGVENIFRVGSIGAMQDHINLRDILLAMGACTDSNYASQFDLPGSFAPTCSYRLLETAVEEAKRMELSYHVGNVVSSDIFYNDQSNVNARWAKMGVMGVEMEAAALYLNAARAGKNALAICTVSDHVFRGESLPAEDRQNSFTQMMELALNTALKLEE